MACNLYRGSPRAAEGVSFNRACMYVFDTLPPLLAPVRPTPASGSLPSRCPRSQLHAPQSERTDCATITRGARRNCEISPALPRIATPALLRSRNRASRRSSRAHGAHALRYVPNPLPVARPWLAASKTSALFFVFVMLDGSTQGSYHTNSPRPCVRRNPHRECCPPV